LFCFVLFCLGFVVVVVVVGGGGGGGGGGGWGLSLVSPQTPEVITMGTSLRTQWGFLSQKKKKLPMQGTILPWLLPTGEGMKLLPPTANLGWQLSLWPSLICSHWRPQSCPLGPSGRARLDTGISLGS
jgi:hypothetical protein